MFNTTYMELRSKLRTLSDSQLAELARNLGMHPDYNEVPEIIVDCAAEYIADTPELARFIPE
jgi:hypothetical protein